MTLPAKTDFVAEGLGYLRQAFTGRPNITGTLTAFLQHAQAIEDAAQQLNGLYAIDTSVGSQLDGIGAIVGAQRNGLDDETFRLFLYAQIAANHGNASLNTVIELTKKLFQANAVFAKTAHNAPNNGSQNAFIVLMVDAPGLPSRLWPVAQGLIEKNLGGGVQLAQLGQSASKTPFAFAGNQAGLGGFGSTNDPTVGGPLASLITSASS